MCSHSSVEAEIAALPEKWNSGHRRVGSRDMLSIMLLSRQEVGFCSTGESWYTAT